MKKVVVIPGEDAAPEAIKPTVKLLQGMNLEIEWQFPLIGNEAKAQTGSTFPVEAKQAIDASDATLFGATSGPSSKALFYLRWGQQTYANVRPARWIPGYQSPLAQPEGVDFIIVRENLEDLYLRVEGELETLAPLGLISKTQQKPVAEVGRGKFAIKAITYEGSERVIRYAFELARKRKTQGYPGRLTAGCKYNMLPQSDGVFKDVAEQVAGEYPDIEFELFIIDDLAHRLIAQPSAMDVLVMPNLYGDILSDAAAALAGGLGLAPSGCYGGDYAYFESAHGTAPDIQGKHIINPTATLLSAAMMLEYLDFVAAGERLRQAIEAVYVKGESLTPDQGGSASTEAFCEAVENSL